jgi:hypothetical protein
LSVSLSVGPSQSADIQVKTIDACAQDPRACFSASTFESKLKREYGDRDVKMGLPLIYGDVVESTQTLLDR